MSFLSDVTSTAEKLFDPSVRGSAFDLKIKENNSASPIAVDLAIQSISPLNPVLRRSRTYSSGMNALSGENPNRDSPELECIEKKSPPPIISSPSNGREFIARLKEINFTNKESSKVLPLSGGRQCLERDFVRMPLFSHTLEKHEVFGSLCELVEDDFFKEEYRSFLQAITSEDESWADKYEIIPGILAVLALFAYLDGEINQEGFIVAQVLATAYAESPESARYLVLTEKNIENHLKQYNYLTEESSKDPFHFLRELSQRSVLERTAVLYKATEGIDLNIYQLGKFTGNATMGFSDMQDVEMGCYVSLLPLWLTQNLYQELFLPTFIENGVPPPPTSHAVICGYRQRKQDLKEGRPISVPSPILHTPEEVHAIKSKKIGIWVHDLLGHCRTDWMHSYAHDLIQLGSAVLEELGPEFLQLGIDLLDRAVEPHSKDPARNVARFIKGLMKGRSATDYRKFYEVCRQHLPKEISDKVLEDCKYRHEVEGLIFLLRSK